MREAACLQIRELQAFVAVAESGSFSLAARQLYVTQSAVSRRIGALERANGVRLLRRSSRAVTLTSAGRLVLPEVVRLLAQHAAAVDAFRRAR